MLEATKTLDYYEFLQISPHADYETIHRVYRYLASRFHPDNPDTGDSEKFFLLKSAYDVLSDPDRRSEYDRDYESEEPSRNVPLSQAVDFMDQVQGELNRRLAILAVLYYKRRSNPFNPQVSLSEIEHRMGFPRDYLDFTTWYLSKKGFITRADNSDFALTAEGVDYIESQRARIPVLNRLLTSGNIVYKADVSHGVAKLDPATASLDSTSTAMVALPDSRKIPERRMNNRERRSNQPDWRNDKLDRRKASRRVEDQRLN
jgi:curved DNA-binding protein CbpA